MHKRYLVTGNRRYRNHEPGDIFEARLDPDAERRAVDRGSIKVLAVVYYEPGAGNYELPEDWPPRGADAAANRDAERRLSHIQGGKK